jgi:hypothetical protein
VAGASPRAYGYNAGAAQAQAKPNYHFQQQNRAAPKNDPSPLRGGVLGANYADYQKQRQAEIDALKQGRGGQAKAEEDKLKQVDEAKANEAKKLMEAQRLAREARNREIERKLKEREEAIRAKE